MITAVDTNVLIDVFGADEKFGRKSLAALRYWSQKGTLIASDIVWVETATVFSQPSECKRAMEKLGIEYSPLAHDSIWVAADAWRNYRRNGGKRDRIASDFLVAAHALVQGTRLLSRDLGFYRTHFTKLKVIDPSEDFS